MVKISNLLTVTFLPGTPQEKRKLICTAWQLNLRRNQADEEGERACYDGGKGRTEIVKSVGEEGTTGDGVWLGSRSVSTTAI